jgi:hypothetical protein
MDKKVTVCFFQLLLKVLVILMFNKTANSFGQDKVLLKPGELPGFELRSEGKQAWGIGDNSQLFWGVRQLWQVSGTKEVQMINIEYIEFPTLPFAILGTSYQAHSLEIGFVWGSPTGHIVGEET